MENNLELEINENGKVVLVTTVTQTEKVLFSSKELKRQIDEHQAIIDNLRPQYESVLAFEQENNVVDDEDEAVETTEPTEEIPEETEE